MGRGAIDFESRETELETWKNGVDRFLSSREERSRTDRSGRGGRNRYRGEIQTSRDSCYPLLLGEEKKRKKNTRYLKTPRIEGAMLGEFVSFSISCSIEEHAGAEVDAEKRVQRKMEGKRERIQAMQAWIGEVGSYEREDKGYTHTYIHIYV